MIKCQCLIFQSLMCPFTQFLELKPKVHCCFLNSSICRQLKLATSEVNIFWIWFYQVMRFDRPINCVGEMINLEFQSPVRCSWQFLKPSNRPPDTHFTVCKKCIKSIFNDKFVIIFNSSKFRRVSVSVWILVDRKQKKISRTHFEVRLIPSELIDFPCKVKRGYDNHCNCYHI